MMKRLRILLISASFVLLSIVSFQSFGQENIATARPTSSIGAWTLPTNSFQFEQGFTYVDDTLVLDGMFRLAVSKIGEIRVTTLYGSDKIVFGGKVMLLDPGRHNTGLALKLSLDNNLRVLDFRMVASQKINDTFTVIGNVGVIPGGRWYGIALLNIGLGEKFSTYLEAFYEGDFQQYNTGLTYLINSETQIDINTGILNNSNMFIGVGFARRLKFDNLIH